MFLIKNSLPWEMMKAYLFYSCENIYSLLEIEM